MKNDELKVTKFYNEREEVEWWDNNPDFALQLLQQAKAEGKLGHGTAVRKMAEIWAAKKENSAD